MRSFEFCVNTVESLCQEQDTSFSKWTDWMSVVSKEEKPDGWCPQGQPYVWAKWVTSCWPALTCNDIFSSLHHPPIFFRNSMRNDTAAFETQTMLRGPGKGDTLWCQWGLNPLGLFLWPFHLLLFCHLLHSFTHLWTDQMDPKKLFCSTSTNFLLMELAVLSHETFLMKSHSMNCIYVNSSFPSGKSFLLFYSPD